MTTNRRDLALLLPALLAAAEKSASAAPTQLPPLAIPFEDMKTRTNEQGTISRDGFDGLTHSGYHIDMHQTQLEPGKMPHPAHHHEHEELLLVRQGTIDVTIEGKTTRCPPGSVAYIASNQEHGWRNAGDTQAQYFVLALNRAPKK